MTGVPEILLLAVLLITAAFFIDQRRRLRVDRALREEIEGEERRMFDFLHGLGGALQTDSSDKNMHRYIVRGVARVVAAQGGCLYLLDEKSRSLAPAFRTPGCAPLFELPAKLLEEASTNPRALESYLSLEGRPADTGLLGNCLAAGRAARVLDLAAGFPLPRPSPAPGAQTTPALLGPLVYAGKTIGVLCVTGRASGGAFSDNDFEVFKSLTEQSAFALGSALIHQRAHEKQQLDQELKNAGEIQRILLPFAPPALEDFVISAVNYPAKVVSGDYYDYIPVDDTHYGIVIGDVSGKGIPASLIMAMCRSVVRVKAANNTSPAAVLGAVNRFLFSDIREDMFVTMVYAVLSKNSHRVTLARAGHDVPLIYRKSSHSVEAIRQPGLAVGIDSGEVFERVTVNGSFEMESGDTLLLYTDGATEAIDRNGREFGLAPIETALRESAAAGASAVIERISADLRHFLGDLPQNDDITLIALQKR